MLNMLQITFSFMFPVDINKEDINLTFTSHHLGVKDGLQRLQIYTKYSEGVLNAYVIFEPLILINLFIPTHIIFIGHHDNSNYINAYSDVS